jgi:hypothetical protein
LSSSDQYRRRSPSAADRTSICGRWIKSDIRSDLPSQLSCDQTALAGSIRFRRPLANPQLTCRTREGR